MTGSPTARRGVRLHWRLRLGWASAGARHLRRRHDLSVHADGRVDERPLGQSHARRGAVLPERDGQRRRAAGDGKGMRI